MNASFSQNLDSLQNDVPYLYSGSDNPFKLRLPFNKTSFTNIIIDKFFVYMDQILVAPQGSPSLFIKVEGCRGKYSSDSNCSTIIGSIEPDLSMQAFVYDPARFDQALLDQTNNELVISIVDANNTPLQLKPGGSFIFGCTIAAYSPLLQNL